MPKRQRISENKIQPQPRSSIDMNQRDQLVSNSLINLISVFINGALQVVLVPVLLIVLKDNGLGILAAMGAFHTYSLLLNLGFGSAIDRAVPRHLVHREIDHINTIINTSIVYFTGILLLIAAGTVISATTFTRWFKVTPDLAHTAILGVYITGLLVAIRMPLIPYAAVLSGMQRYDLLRITEIGIRTFRTLAILAFIWFLSQPSALIFVILLNALDPLLTSLLAFWLAYRYLPGLKIRPMLARWACFRGMLGYSINSFLYVMGTLIMSESSIFIILYYMSDSDAGLYAIPLYLVRFLNLVVVAFTQGIKPAVSRLEAEGSFEQIRQTFLRGSCYANFLVISTCMSMAVASKLLLIVWVGPERADLWPVLTIMAVGYGAFYTQYTSYFVMAGLGRHVVFGIMIIGVSLLNIVLGIAILKHTNWGLIGVAAGTCVPMLLSSILIIPYTCRVLRVQLRDYAHYALLKPTVVTLPLLVISGAAVYFGIEHPTIALTSLTMVGGLVFAVSVWKTGLTEPERSTFTEMTFRRLPFLPLDQRVK
jgi:O-antigen/teichoic acid export membrane protein